jgi:hypothetical protein
MKPKVNPATDIVNRARAAYPQNVAAARAYFGPIPYGAPTPVSREQADLQLAQMGPNEIIQLAQTNAIAAEQAAQRLNLMDARAAALPPETYSDIGPED